jgi:hypothetical protein
MHDHLISAFKGKGAIFGLLRAFAGKVPSSEVGLVEALNILNMECTGTAGTSTCTCARV